MSARSLRGLLSAPVLALALTHCVPRYEPPTADQPHAVLKLRRTYEEVAGSVLSEAVEIEDHVALHAGVAAELARAPRTDALLAHPIPQTFEVLSEFSHHETRQVYESYQEPHTSYETESYDCSSGFGTSKTFRTCTRSVPRTRYETKWRWVTRTIQVSDGACSAALRFAPENRHVYLLQYTYSAPSVCALSCFEQIGAPDGTFRDQSCPAAPPEK
jgi:hypothetical protein